MDSGADTNTTGYYTDDRRAPYETPRSERMSIVDKMTFSPSYTTNTVKETIVIDFVENFRSQFTQLYPSRPPLLLTPVNECGRPKFISSYIRPTLLPYLELYDYRSCAKFVAGYIKYEDFEDHGTFPHRVICPTTTLDWQVGNSVEISNLLCSLLIASGYDAYVCLGHATLEVVVNDQKGIMWPEHLPDEPLSEDDEGRVETALNTRFAEHLKRRPTLESEFDKNEGKRKTTDGHEDDEEQVTSTPQVDDEAGEPETHCHAWVLIRPNQVRKADPAQPDLKEQTEPFFLEPSTGAIVQVDSSNYLRIEAVYNHQNYLVHMNPDAHPANMSYDLYDLTSWEHVFLSDPHLTSEDESTRAAAADFMTTDDGAAGDFLIDLPASWVDRLSLSRAHYENRYPGRTKVLEYKNAVVTLFAEYSDPELRVKEVLVPDDVASHHMQCHTFYQHRTDHLRRKSVYPAAEGGQKARKIHEWYLPGRKKESRVEGLREVISEPGVRQTLRFYWAAREDGLASRTQIYFNDKDPHPKKVIELYRDRVEDRLWYRSATYASTSDTSGTNLSLLATGTTRDHAKEETRTPAKMTEKFRRNPKVNASEDVMKRTFIKPSANDGEIWLDFHYGKDCITHASRKYHRAADRGREYGATLSSNNDENLEPEVVTMPFEAKPRAHELRDELKALLEAEKECMSKIRERQAECRDVYESRNTGGTEKLVSTYDTLRNRPQETEEEREMLRREEQRRQQRGKDYLAPYIASLAVEKQLSGDYRDIRLSADNAKAVRDAYLKDVKERLIQRGHIMQARMDKEKEELARRQVLYQKNADGGDASKDNEEYGKFLRQAAWRMKILDERLGAHINQASEQYAKIVAKLAKDPRLSEAY